MGASPLRSSEATTPRTVAVGIAADGPPAAAEIATAILGGRRQRGNQLGRSWDFVSEVGASISTAACMAPGKRATVASSRGPIGRIVPMSMAPYSVDHLFHHHRVIIVGPRFVNFDVGDLRR